MNLNNFDYKNNYNIFTNYLYSLQDKNYLEFHKGILNDDKANIIGIRIPILKKIAKEIAKSNYDDFIKYNKHNTYEEIMLHGLVIGYLKRPFKEILDYLNIFIPYNTNWAVNDTVCANLKIFKKNLDEGYKYINKLIKSNNAWNIRFGLVLLLDHYINNDYIDKILNISNNIKNDEYYVKMANAWLISFCYIKYPKETNKFLLNNKLDDLTFNKAISKICDSYRVDNDKKEILKKLKK